MKKLLIIALLPLLFGCKPKVNNEPKLNANGWQDLDLGTFKISIPPNWKYQKQQGRDSFVGEIKGPGVSLSFDFSGMGYANHLISTEQEYLNGNDWRNYEPDPKTKVSIHFPTVQQKVKYPKADYIADITSPKTINTQVVNNKTISFPIEIPTEIKDHNFHIDTTDKYIIKTIWSKIPSKGTTGVYYQAGRQH